jgi:hypothetical protein
MILIQFDGRYHRWAMLLLRSLGRHEPGRRVLCDTVGLDPEEVHELRRAHPRVICRNEPVAGPVSPAEMANRKPFVLRDAIDGYPEEPWFCLLDADMLVRRPLDDLWALAGPYQAALSFTDGTWGGRFYLRLLFPSGVVLVRRDARILVDRWAFWHGHDEPVDGVRPREWFWDQVTLFLAWCDCDLRIGSIPLPVFANDGFEPGAAIWSAHVPDKERCFHVFNAELERQGALPEGGGVPAAVSP